MSFASVGPRTFATHIAGVDYASSRFTLVFSTATSPTPRAWVEVTASLPFDAVGFHMYSAGGNNTHTATDVAIGAAGSEVIIVHQFMNSDRQDSDYHRRDPYIPVRIPRGSRVVCRVQTFGNVNVGYQFVFYARSPLYPVGGSLLVQHGLDMLNGVNGVAVSPGASAHTMGAWTEIVPATSHPYMALGAFLAVPASATFTGNVNKVFEIGIGPASSEVTLLRWGGIQINFRTLSPQIPLFPVHIPSGARLSVRMQTSDATRDISTSAVALYGLVP